jgi:hypothetical protein
MNNRQKAICLLITLGSILVLVAGWNMPQPDRLAS